MFHRLALVMLLGAVCACDAPPRVTESMQPKAPKKEAEPALTKQQVSELSEQCGKKAREEFRRGWKDGTVATADGNKTAEFTNHYSVKLKTCFYLLTVNHTASTLGKTLFDINEGEQYGEYLGPATDESPAASQPASCRVTGFYCASRREWEVLIGPYMED